MVEVQLEQSIYSSVPGQVGNWAIVRKVELPAVPRGGDWVEPAKGWGLERVRETAFLLGSSPVVTLEPLQTDDPARLSEAAELVAEHGWEQLAGPWRNQGAT